MIYEVKHTVWDVTADRRWSILFLRVPNSINYQKKSWKLCGNMEKTGYFDGRSYYHVILMTEYKIKCFLGISRAQNHRCIREIIFIHSPTSPSRHFFPRQVVVELLYIFEVRFMVFHDINSKNWLLKVHFSKFWYFFSSIFTQNTLLLAHPQHFISI